MLRRYAGAETATDRAAGLAPTDVTIFEQKVMVSLARGDLDGARRTLRGAPTGIDSTELIAIRLYKLAFQEWQTGKSCALAYIVLIMVLAITNIYVKYLNQAKDR